MEEERKIVKTNELSKLACCDISLSDSNKESLRELLQEKKCRQHFLSVLNKYRTSGKFDISKISFENIGIVLNYILDSFDRTDYESAKYCLILSQTYHCYFNGIKVSLQNKILDHVLLKKVDFWENFIACNII